jgi:hypothetical protein
MRRTTALALLTSALAFAGVIIELTASHTGPQPYPQFWQGQVRDRVVISYPDSITKIFMKGNEVSICIIDDSTAVLWSPSNRTVHVGGE